MGTLALKSREIAAINTKVSEKGTFDPIIERDKRLLKGKGIGTLNTKLKY